MEGGEGIRDSVASRGVGDVFKKQVQNSRTKFFFYFWFCFLYTSDAADEQRGVERGSGRIIYNKKISKITIKFLSPTLLTATGNSTYITHRSPICTPVFL